MIRHDGCKFDQVGLQKNESQSSNCSDLFMLAFNLVGSQSVLPENSGMPKSKTSSDFGRSTFVWFKTADFKTNVLNTNVLFLLA